jgi:hypothetical protein
VASLEFVVKRHNIPVESVQKETVSLHKRDCRARATHPSAVDHTTEIAKRAAGVRRGIIQSG